MIPNRGVFERKLGRAFVMPRYHLGELYVGRETPVMRLMALEIAFSDLHFEAHACRM